MILRNAIQLSLWLLVLAQPRAAEGARFRLGPQSATPEGSPLNFTASSVHHMAHLLSLSEEHLQAQIASTPGTPPAPSARVPDRNRSLALSNGTGTCGAESVSVSWTRLSGTNTKFETVFPAPNSNTYWTVNISNVCSAPVTALVLTFHLDKLALSELSPLYPAYFWTTVVPDARVIGAYKTDTDTYLFVQVRPRATPDVVVPPDSAFAFYFASPNLYSIPITVNTVDFGS